MEGVVITIPNKEMAATSVANHSTTGSWRYASSVGLVYETSSEELERALAALREIIAAHPNTEKGAARFMSFGDSALVLAFAYFVTEPTAPRYLDTVSELNLAIKERFDREGWDMAFPSQTLYVEGPIRVETRSAS